MKRATLGLAVLALLLGGVGQGRADYIATVTLDTSALTTNPSQGPFSFRFSMEDDSNLPQGINNNTATISNFNLHGGSLTSGTSNSGGSVSGDLNPGHTLTLTDNDSGFFQQNFRPGSSTPSSLSFTLDLTTNVNLFEAGSPDSFAFEVFSNDFESTAGSLFIDITGPSPEVTLSSGSLGNGVSVPAPVVTPVVSSAGPEPSTLTLLGLGFLGLLGYGWRRRNRAAA
jgi:hypothetical protein